MRISNREHTCGATNSVRFCARWCGPPRICCRAPAFSYALHCDCRARRTCLCICAYRYVSRTGGPIGASYACGLFRLLRGDSQIATARRTIGRPFVSSAGWPDDPNRRHHFRVLAAFYCDIDGASCRSRNSHTCSLATRSDTSVRRQHRCAEYCCLTLAEADKRSRDARSARDLYGRLQLILWRWPDRRTSTTLQYGAERDGAQP